MSTPHKPAPLPRRAEGLSRRELVAAGGVLAATWAAGSKAGASEGNREPELRNRVADLEAPGPEVYRARIEKAQRLLTEHRLGALFVEASPSLSYFTGVRWGQSERVFGVILPRSGEPIYLCPAFEEGRARERITVGSELRSWQEDESPYARIQEALTDRGLATAPLALAPASRLFVYYGLSGLLTVVDGTELINRCRGHKSGQEIALMRRANEITQTAIEHAARQAREGMTQAEMAALVRQAHVAQGVPPGWALVLFGPNAAYPHGTSAAYRLRPGDVVLMDCGSQVHGYQSDITRTYVFGRPANDRQRRIWRAVRRAQDAAFDLVKPGVLCGAIDRAARLVIEEAGFGRGYEHFTHRLGHGIGMQGHEWPYLVGGSKVALAPGMTTSNEPGIYIVGELGLRLEDIIHVTAEGCEYLSTPATELETVGA